MTGSARELPPAIFLMGPTATGKTDLALSLADQLPLEIISVDSALIYRGMDIGTAKPDPEVLARWPHRMIDIRDAAEPFSVADFVVEATQHMQSIVERGHIPLLVGGTMMYFRALLEGLADIPPIAIEIRHQIEQQADHDGWPALHRELMQIDPETAQRLHPNHSRRIQRALEVYRGTGKTLSHYRAEQIRKGGIGLPINEYFQVVQLALLPANRQYLHQRIAERFQSMLQQGFENEVRTLFERGDLTAELPALRAVGYRQMWQYLAGDLDYDQMADKGIAATRQLAKRQLTWLRNWSELNRIFIDQDNGKPKIKQLLLEETLNILREYTIY